MAKRSLQAKNIRSLALVGGGMAVLIGIATLFSISPMGQQIAMEGGPQVGAVWESATTSYSGSPMLSWCTDFKNQTPHCNGVNPRGTVAVFSAYPTADPSQMRLSYAWGSTHRTNTNASNPPFFIAQFTSYNTSQPVVVPAGQQLTLEWSCHNSTTVWAPLGCTSYDVFGQCNVSGKEGFNYIYNYFSGSTGVGFGTGNARRGTVTITPPPGNTTYQLTCRGAAYQGETCGSTSCPGWSATKPGNAILTVPVSGAAALPTLTITGNGTNPTTVQAGQNVVIAGTYVAGVGDTLTQTALNDSTSTALPGVAWTPPVAKTYTFNTSTPGAYTFYPAARTTTYPSWNNYGQSLTVVVQCPAGQVQQAGTCVPAQCPVGSHQTNPPLCNQCESGYTMQAGVCVAQNCPAGSHQTNPPACNQCEVGYVRQGGSCVLGVCPGPNQVNYPTCNCAPGYSLQGGQCVASAPADIDSFEATPTRVHRNDPVSLRWTTTGMTSCTVTSPTHGTVSTALTSAGTNATIQTETTFTLRCSDGVAQYTEAVVVRLLPEFEEI